MNPYTAITILACTAGVLLFLLFITQQKLIVARRDADLWQTNADGLAKSLIASHKQTAEVIQNCENTIKIARTGLTDCAEARNRLDQIHGIITEKESIEAGSTARKSIVRWSDWRADIKKE